MKHVFRFFFGRTLDRSSFSSYTVAASLVLAVLASVVLVACQTNPNTELNMPQLSQDPLVIPAGFPRPVVPANNPVTPAKVDLGRYLFYDASLSKEGTKSCSGCHAVSNSFSDVGHAVSIGSRGESGSRNAPALVNIAYDTTFFWDGRASSLEMQAGMPIMNPVEMDNDSMTVVNTLNKSGFYRAMFANAFGDNSADGNSITFTRICQALATFERTFISGSSDYDRFIAGDSSAMSASAIRGFNIFKSDSVSCISCHSGVNFTDNNYHSTGIVKVYSDEGREDVTDMDTDNGKFRTPTLRNVALTAPYEHDGSFTTLLQVVDHYNNGGMSSQNQDPLIKQLHLSKNDEQDVIAFLDALTDHDFVTRSDFKAPNQK